MEMQRERLSLHEAAQCLKAEGLSVPEAERVMALAIEHGELPASVKRWATEQWEGNHLPGNMIRQETFIEGAALEGWLRRRAARSP